jgi:hypothetical protein
VTTAHFQHVFVTQIDLRGDVMIKLDAGAVWLVRWIELQTDWRVGFKGVVEKQHLLATQAACEKGIPEPPDGFADSRDGEEAFEE